MQHSGWNLLSNISVRSKLTLGFSLLIGMILLVAYTGWQATDTLRGRSERMGDIAGFSTLARDMRIERLVYFVKADDGQATKWLAALDRTEKQLLAVQPNFSSPVNLSLIAEAESTLKKYRDFYNQTVAATREREATRQIATVAAEAANEHLQGLSKVANAETGRFEDRQLVADLFLSVQRMRVNLRAYASLPSKEAEDAARSAITTVLTQIKGLESSDLPSNAVQKLLGEVNNYQQ